MKEDPIYGPPSSVAIIKSCFYDFSKEFMKSSFNSMKILNSISWQDLDM
jgi:hypothetical protein